MLIAQRLTMLIAQRLLAKHPAKALRPAPNLRIRRRQHSMRAIVPNSLLRLPSGNPLMQLPISTPGPTQFSLLTLPLNRQQGLLLKPGVVELSSLLPLPEPLHRIRGILTARRALLWRRGKGQQLVAIPQPRLLKVVWQQMRLARLPLPWQLRHLAR